MTELDDAKEEALKASEEKSEVKQIIAELKLLIHTIRWVWFNGLLMNRKTPYEIAHRDLWLIIERLEKIQ